MANESILPETATSVAHGPGICDDLGPHSAPGTPGWPRACARCGAALESGAIICVRCGAALESGAIICVRCYLRGVAPDVLLDDVCAEPEFRALLVGFRMVERLMGGAR